MRVKFSVLFDISMDFDFLIPLLVNGHQSIFDSGSSLISLDSFLPIKIIELMPGVEKYRVGKKNKPVLSKKQIIIVSIFALLTAFLARNIIHDSYRFPVHTADNGLEAIEQDQTVYVIPRVELSKINRENVLYFYHPVSEEFQFFRKVAGLPGDQISAENGRIRINNQIIQPSRDDDIFPAPGDNFTVPEGHFYLLADNLSAIDSRHFGPIPYEKVLGLLAE